MSRIGRLGGTRSAGRRTAKQSPEGGASEMAPGNGNAEATESTPGEG
jgi:hypothetical protein